MNEDKRRRIAREFLETNFGKDGICDGIIINGQRTKARRYFELWRNYASIGSDGKEARAFDVYYPPYPNPINQPVIIVAENKEELDEVSSKLWGFKTREFKVYKNCFIAYK